MNRNAPGPTPVSLEFSTFWHGPVDPIIYTCLASFPFHGRALRLYSYDPDVDVPAGVLVARARQIVADEALTSRFPVDGRASYSKFSN